MLITWNKDPYTFPLINRTRQVELDMRPERVLPSVICLFWLVGISMKFPSYSETHQNREASAKIYGNQLQSLEHPFSGVYVINNRHIDFLSD